MRKLRLRVLGYLAPGHPCTRLLRGSQTQASVTLSPTLSRLCCDYGDGMASGATVASGTSGQAAEGPGSLHGTLGAAGGGGLRGRCLLGSRGAGFRGSRPRVGERLGLCARVWWYAESLSPPRARPCCGQAGTSTWASHSRLGAPKLSLGGVPNAPQGWYIRGPQCQFSSLTSDYFGKDLPSRELNHTSGACSVCLWTEWPPQTSPRAPRFA